MKLHESKEISVVTPLPISNYLIQYLKAFQEFLSYLNLSDISFDTASILRDKVLKFKKYNFAKQMLEDIDQYINETKSAKESTIDFDTQLFEKVKKGFMSGNYKSVMSDVEKLRNHNALITKVTENKAKNYKAFVKTISYANHFFNGGQRSGLFDSYDSSTIREIIDIDVTKYSYSYLFPQVTSSGLKVPDRTSEIHYLSYIILHLKPTSKPIRLAAEEYEIYQRIMNPKFETIRELVNKYAFNNDKSVVSTIESLMDNDLRRAMLATSRTNRVYRGLNVDEDENISEKAIEAADKKTKYVSTTKLKHVAERFAKGLGHLMDQNTETSGQHIVLTYSITPDAIVIDTSIFGQAYNENDILIDATKAKLIDVERI